MKRLAVFIDAGYFWVQLCKTITGTYNSRAQVTVDYAAFHAALLAEIRAQFPDGDLLRVYWYDGPGSSGKTAEHRAIDALDDFKLRLGTRNGVGQQKGVDGLIIADLISLTQQKAITHAMLMSGDADTAPGVVAAQSMGLRVHLLSLGAAAATSPYLAAEVDLKRSWGLAEVSAFATQTAAPVATTSALGVLPAAAPANPSGAAAAGAAAPAVPPPAPASMAAIASAAHAQISSSPLAAALAAIPAGTFSLPRDIDKELLTVGRAHIGRSLTDPEKRDLRREFRALL